MSSAYKGSEGCRCDGTDQTAGPSGPEHEAIGQLLAGKQDRAAGHGVGQVDANWPWGKTNSTPPGGHTPTVRPPPGPKEGRKETRREETLGNSKVPEPVEEGTTAAGVEVMEGDDTTTMATATTTTMTRSTAAIATTADPSHADKGDRRG